MDYIIYVMQTTKSKIAQREYMFLFFNNVSKLSSKDITPISTRSKNVWELHAAAVHTFPGSWCSLKADCEEMQVLLSILSSPFIFL